MEKIDVIYMRRYIDKFPYLFDDDKIHNLTSAIDTIYAMFLGLNNIFPELRQANVCYSLLVCWFLADMFPEETRGVITNGGGMIASKVIGGVKITFTTNKIYGANAKDILEDLNTNMFGKMARMMIKNSYLRLGFYWESLF